MLFGSPIKSISTIFSETETPRVLSKIWSSYIEKATLQDYLCMYINVPFCSQHCSFCEYPSKLCRNGIADSCLTQLEQRFEYASSIFHRYPISVLMFGGGSPSLLSVDQLHRLFAMIDKYWNIDLNPAYERGFELHPSQASDKLLQVLQTSIINRISMGVQSFDPRVLKAENRTLVLPQRLAEILDALKDTVRVTNLDLLAGLRHQTSEILIRDIQKLLLLEPQIITIYELNAIRGHRVDSEKIRQMLRDVYFQLPTLQNIRSYDYVGTTLQEFQHCNRLYQKKAPVFERAYSPAPTGFNNILSFSLDDSSRFSQHAWSHFHPLDLAYEVKGNRLYVYSMKAASQVDRPAWQHAFKIRGAYEQYDTNCDS